MRIYFLANGADVPFFAFKRRKRLIIRNAPPILATLGAAVEFFPLA